MIRLQQKTFDIGGEIKSLVGSRTDIGAVVSFTGLVKDLSAGRNVATMMLEHYPAMAQKELEKIEREAHARWSLQESLVIHRFGKLEPGDYIVLVITASVHRGDAFEAAQFLMDWLKTKAPFWKLETGESQAHWVTARNQDEDAAARWFEAGTKP